MTSTTAQRVSAPPFALLAVLTVLAVSTYTLVPPALPDIVAHFRVTPSSAGLVLSATTAPGILLAPLVGALADRFGRRRLLAGCLLVFAASGGLASAAPSFELLVALRLAQGIGGAGLISLVVTVIADCWDGPARAAMLGRNAAVLTAALVVLPPLGGALTALGSWRWTLVPYLLGVPAAWAVLRALPDRQFPDRALTAQLREAAARLRRRPVVGWFVQGALAFLLMFGLLLTVLPHHLAVDHGLGPWTRGLLLALPALPSMGAALALGRLTARFGSRALLTAGFAAWALAFALIAVAPGPMVLVAGLLVYGLGEGLAVPTLQNTVAGAADPDSRATVVSLFVGATRAGQTAGPLLVAPLVGDQGDRLAFALGAVTAALLIPFRAPRKTA